MKALLLTLAVALTPISAHAINRYYNTGRMSCERIHAIIDRDGAAVLHYRSPRGAPLYDRYVADGGFCPSYNIAVTTYIPSSDTPSCPVYRCEQGDFYPGIIGFGD